MFDSLTDQMGIGEHSKEAQRERLLHYGFIVGVAIVVVAAVFLVMRFVS